ncbi:MAG TPA: hypothetical protein ENI53_01825 [Thermoplasmatales archaeon]|nr:hypothetical protein [Thermoplasmatales archaeon]
MKEKVKYKAEWEITKIRARDEKVRREIENKLKNGEEIYNAISRYPDDVEVKHEFMRGNVLLNEGINTIWALVAGDAGETPFNNSNAHLGVGDSAVAEDAGQTGLQGTNKTYMGMDNGYPQYGSNQQIVFRATFGENDANHAWNEFTVVNASDDTGKNLNRKVESKGIKSSGEIWTLTLTITLS